MQPLYSQNIQNHLVSQQKDFQQLVTQISPITNYTLNFFECNRFIKLKAIDYISDQRVVSYYRDIFSKKTNNSVRRKWHVKDKFVLFWVVYKLCMLKGIQNLRMRPNDWEDVASILKLPSDFLMRKWISLIRHTTLHFRWNFDEQQTLKSQMTSFVSKQKWSQLALKVYKLSNSDTLRTCKDVRQHWKNYLDPQLKKAAWSQFQDSELLKLIDVNGKKWSCIAKILGGRTQNQVKNRYIALMKKQNKLHELEKQHIISSSEDEISECQPYQKRSTLSNHHDTFDSIYEQQLSKCLPLQLRRSKSSMMLQDI